jgi:hypothetical protein
MKRNMFGRCFAWAVLAGSLLANPALALQWPAANNPSADTQLLYHFDETGTTVVDSSTNGLNGTLENAGMRVGSAPGWLTSPSGNYIQQPASSTYSNKSFVAVPVNFNRGVSLSAWLRLRAGETQEGLLFSTVASGARNYVTLDNFATEARINMTINGVGATVRTISDANWHHIAMVYDPLDGDASNGGTWKMYIDNILTNSANTTSNLAAVTQFNLGVGEWQYGNLLKGADYDEVMVVNSTITDFSSPVVGIPTVGEWGMIILFVLLVFVGWKKLRRPELASVKV